MIKNVKFTIIIIFILFIFIIFLKGLEKPNNYTPKNTLNKFEYSFSAKSLYKNEDVSLEELTISKNFSLINIWASWCLPCRTEHSYLVDLKKIKNLNIIGINYKDKKINAKKFLDDLGNPYSEILMDMDGTKSIELGAYGVPETYLINNKTREIIKRYIGPLDETKYKQIIKIIKK
tara:strand:- start:546 stop:1073 length:528 start_codon:yes stop_codon:yes gene_type:complete